MKQMLSVLLVLLTLAWPPSIIRTVKGTVTSCNHTVNWYNDKAISVVNVLGENRRTYTWVSYHSCLYFGKYVEVDEIGGVVIIVRPQATPVW